MRLRVASLAVLAALGSPVRAVPQPSAADPPSIAALQAWVDAVKSHQPGMQDKGVIETMHLVYKTRVHLNTAMPMFMRYLEMERLQTPAVTRDNEQRRAREIAHSVTQSPGREVFLKRAAVLHSDAAILTDRTGGFEDPTAPRPVPWSERSRAQASYAAPPLLTSRSLLKSRDGQVIGDASSNWNWPFARWLLDQVGPRPVNDARAAAPAPSGDRFSADWYHATAAYMFEQGLYADAALHLQRAVVMFPADPRILFDRGCYAEIAGMPMQQVLRSDPNGRGIGGIPDEAATNSDAMQWFRRALEGDSGFVEARVRLARLLGIAGEHEQALAEVQRALASAPKGEVAFYAHLFGGRAALALGRLDEARRHFTEAIALFPEAQSALLGQSQVALFASDLPGAVSPIKSLQTRSKDVPNDPWWAYHLGAGRDSHDLLVGLWATVPR